MKLLDLLCSCLGLGQNASTIDNICNNFDVKITEKALYETLNVFRGRDYARVGNALIWSLYETIIEEWCKKGLKEEKFDLNVNSDASEIRYEGKLLASKEDLEKVTDKLKKTKDYDNE